MLFCYAPWSGPDERHRTAPFFVESGESVDGTLTRSSDPTLHQFHHWSCLKGY